MFKNVFDAHEIRRKAIELNEWVDYMSMLLTLKYKNLDKSERYHRWFDAGDVQSFSHLMKIFEVCEHTPQIKHWLATREYQFIKDIKEEDVPKNLCLRVSAIKVDSPPPNFWKWTSGVHKDKPAVGRECPAPKQNGECGSCRACWSRKVKQVSYKEH
jgi:hypothetical protein